MPQNKGYTEDPLRCTCPCEYMQICAVYLQEGGPASQYSVFIGQYMQLIGSYLPEQVAFCDMREKRNFKGPDTSGSYSVA